MRRHAEVGEQAVDMLHTIIVHPVLQIAEVAAHEREAVARIGNVALRICILVEAVQMCAVGEARQYLARVATATEGDIHVYAARLDVEPVNALA